MGRTVKLAFLGDINGAPGRAVLEKCLPALRERWAPDVVVANGENARNGSGLTPELYKAFRAMGIDALTLGDHVYRDPKIVPYLERPEEPVARPANLSARSPGKRFSRIPAANGRTRDIYVVTVLGRVFFPLPANDPFTAVDEVIAAIPERRPIVVVEAHMEATSEKAALAAWVDGRAALVAGSHTHVPTADARILRKGTAFITDMGMCGPYDSVIGRQTEAVVRHMTTALPVHYEMGQDDARICGVFVEISEDTGLANCVERIELT
jgi:metallophosphoesterase (TIGR00282 family)